MAIAVVHDRNDALALLTRAPRAAAVLALTPNARAALKGAAVNLLDPLPRYGDWKQARTVVRVSAARRRMLAALAPLRPIEREILIDQLNRVAYGACRLWYLLGAEGPWLVPHDEGFREVSERRVAFEAMLGHMLSGMLAGHRRAARVKAPPLPRLYRALRRLAMLPGRRAGATLLVGTLKSQFGLHESLARQPRSVRTVLASPAVGGWKEYPKLGRELLRALMGGRLVQAALTCTPDGRGAALADRAIAALRDPVIEAALMHCRDLLADRLAHAGSAREDAARLVRQLKPSAFTAAELSDLGSWALAEACGGAGVKRLVLGRNAHSPSDGRLARDSSAGYFFARYPKGLVDEYLMWSPHGAAAARALLPEADGPRIRAVRTLPPPRPKRDRGKERMILLADSYAHWWYTHSWVYLTSDEYVAAARALCAAVADLPDCRLLVRAKRKLECDLAALEALIEPPANCAIKIRDVPFQDDLADADLLVGFHSTTIEEALHARVPVLLWGGTGRYRYLAARETPPTRHDRAAVYRATSAGMLRPMLAAILDAHAGRPLSDAEVADHVWPAEVPGVEALARWLAGAASEWAPSGLGQGRGTADPTSGSSVQGVSAAPVPR